MTGNLTSIIIPVYNEGEYIIRTLRKCCDLEIKKEVIVVDNNSTDDSYRLVRDYIDRHDSSGCVTLLREVCQGKGNAIKTGLASAKGDYIVFHDADLEYDPRYIPEIVEYLEHYDVVHGCRLSRPYSIGIGPWVANKYLLYLVQRRHKKHLNDIFTGQRGFRKEFLEAIDIESDGFQLETELTLKAIHYGFRIKEIDVSYMPRTHEEGKKIGFVDFLKIIYVFSTVSAKLEKSPIRKGIAHAGN